MLEVRPKLALILLITDHCIGVVGLADLFVDPALGRATCIVLSATNPNNVYLRLRDGVERLVCTITSLVDDILNSGT